MPKKSGGGHMARNLLIAVLVVIVAVVAVAVVRSSLSSQSDLSKAANGGQPVPAGSTQVILVMDGWSYRALSSIQLTYVPVNSNAEPATGVASKNLTFSPANQSTLNQLLSTTPQLVAGLFSRLATPSSKVTCTTTQCQAGSTQLQLSSLLNPSTIAGFGPEYAGYKITSGVYVASAIIPNKAAGFALSGPGYNTLQLSASTSSTPVSTDPGQQPIPADGQNGFLKGIYPVAAGLGQLFPFTPSWVGSNPVPFTSPLPPNIPTGPLSQSQAATNATLFAAGLSVPVSQASGLNASQLSYMTSPTTGCGPAVACVPQHSSATYTAAPTSQVSACYAGTKSATAIILSDSTWSLNYTVPTSQFGSWGGVKPQGYDSATGLYQGLPPLTTGPQKLRQSAALVYTQVTPQLSAVFGKTAQYAKATAAELTAPFDSSALSALGSWTICKSQSFGNP